VHQEAVELRFRQRVGPLLTKNKLKEFFPSVPLFIIRFIKEQDMRSINLPTLVTRGHSQFNYILFIYSDHTPIQLTLFLITPTIHPIPMDFKYISYFNERLLIVYIWTMVTIYILGYNSCFNSFHIPYLFYAFMAHIRFILYYYLHQFIKEIPYFLFVFYEILEW
jgi:hypothetical protein